MYHGRLFKIAGMKVVEIGLETLELKYEKMRLHLHRREAQLLTSLSEHGQHSPIVVVRSSLAGRYIVVDGYKRVRCLKKLKADIAKAVIWETDEPQALVMVHQQSAGSRWSVLEQSWLIHELYGVWGWNLGKLAVKFDRSRSWISRRLALVKDLPSWMHAKVRSGEIGTYVALKYLVPLARANAAACEKLAGKISGQNLSSRQVGQLYTYYMASGRKERERLLENPMRFLKAQEEAKKGFRDLNLSEEENRILRNLELIGNVAGGLAHSLGKVINYDTSDELHLKLVKAWKHACGRMERLSEAMSLVSEASQGLIPRADTENRAAAPLEAVEPTR